MGNKYGQILLTYVTNWRRVPLAAGMSVCGLIIVANSRSPAFDPGGMIFPLFLVAAIISHLKQQITTPQARLIPHYRLPHLIVAGLLLLPALLLPPLVASLPHTNTEPAFILKERPPNLGNYPPATLPSYDVVAVPPTPHSSPYFPLFSLYLALSAWLAWLIYENSRIMIAITIGGFVATDVPPIHRAITQFIAMPFSVVAVLLCAASLIALGALARSLFHLTEEMPEYSRNNNFFGGRAAASNGLRISSKPDYTSRWQQFFSAAASDRAIDRVTTSSHQTFLQRVARWRAPTKSITALLMPVFICVAGLVIDSQVKSGAGGVPFIWLMLWFLPIMVSLSIATRRRSMLGYESLRPVSRRDFLAELGFAVGLQFTEVWLSIAAALVVMAAILTPHLLGDPHTWLYLTVSYMVQLVLLAMILWLLRLTTNLMLFFMPIFMLPILIAPFASNLHGANALTPFFCIGAIVGVVAFAVLLAAVILYDAYRRWFVTDLA